MLQTLNLEPIYDSSEHDLIKELFVPLLKESNEYIRGVGFFTSGWLQLASEGLVELIENGGKARIVTSPNLQKSDWEALQLGEEAKENTTLRNILEKSIGDLGRALKSDTLNCLAWMVSDDLLEFVFAVPRKGWEGGDYHDKVAVFIDENSDSVAIHGSFNDSTKASLNGEAFSVFKSWEVGQVAYVQKHKQRLTDLLEDRNPQFHVYEIPEASRQQIISLRTKGKRPYSLTHPAGVKTRRTHKVSEPHCPIDLRAFQETAVNNWLQTNCMGIFEMATGTGKTYASLAAAVNRYRDRARLALIVQVPFLHLLEQWEEHCLNFGFSPILCSGNYRHKGWNVRVQSKIQDFNTRAISQICILTTHDTASGTKFSKATRRLLQEETMIIGDEVHYLGATKLRKALPENAGMRLGLSATPRRWFDPEGTKTITSYFNDVCFEFGLDEAIEQGFLTPYEYFPIQTHLSPFELQDYEAISLRISQLFSIAEEDDEIREELDQLLRKRARIVQSAESKLPQLISILEELIGKANEKEEELNGVLIYCAPGGHKEVLKRVAALGLRSREFVYDVTLKDRRKILQQFAVGDIQVLVAIRCLDEGVDVPATRMAFFLASTSNPREFVQRRGRVLRLANGKDQALLYDFIVVPSPEYFPLKRDVDISLLRREMPRFAEFSSSARNQFAARAIVRDILDQYGMLHLLDKKPWEIYHELVEAQDVEIFQGK